MLLLLQPEHLVYNSTQKRKHQITWLAAQVHCIYRTYRVGGVCMVIISVFSINSNINSTYIVFLSYVITLSAVDTFNDRQSM